MTYINPRCSSPPDRLEITDDKGHEVRAHPYACFKPILKQTTIKFHCLLLQRENTLVARLFQF